MSTPYSVTIENHAKHSATFMVFQNDPGSLSGDALALAWFSKFSNPGATEKFSWQISWGFCWADTGTLAAGVTFSSDQQQDTSLGNEYTLSYNGAYELTTPTQGPDPSRLYIREDSSIPVDSTAAVGITMFGSPVYAVQAMPNTNLTFSPHPQYFLAYGDFVPGQVLDLSTVNNPVELKFETGVQNLHVILNADNSWGVPTSLRERNQNLLVARKQPVRKLATA
jgi:hypothetical protein